MNKTRNLGLSLLVGLSALSLVNVWRAWKSPVRPALGLPSSTARAVVPPTIPKAEKRAASSGRSMLSHLPIRFDANEGQWSEPVRFVSRSSGATLFITDEAMTLGLRGAKPAAVTMKLVGARPSSARGEHALETKTNYFVGNDRSQWRSNVPSYGQVRVKEWLPGVDVVWHGGDQGLEYDVEVARGVDAGHLELEIDGANELRVAGDGSLEMATEAGTLVQKPPHVLQGGRELPTRYVLSGPTRVRFAMDGYDAQEPVLIDPVLAYSTYLGGNDVNSTGDSFTGDLLAGMAVDGSGNLYVAGNTPSTNFPTHTPMQPTTSGGYDAFVSKLDPTGTMLLYSTYFGGTGGDGADCLALDAAGNVYFGGFTSSTDLPTVTPLQAALAGTADGFIAKLDASGSALVYSTYVGGADANGEGLTGIAVDATGNAFFLGYTSSTSFPTHAPMQAVYGGGFYDAFVGKLDPSGTALVYATYLGGAGGETPGGIALDASGNAYVTGQTSSANFPTKTPFQSALKGDADVFVTKINPAGTALVYSTYLGGTGSSGRDMGNAIAVDAAGNAYVTGQTDSNDFPTQGPVQAAIAGTYNAFVSKLSPAGTALVYSTFVGGSGLRGESGHAIAVDGAGDAYVAGETDSTNFPTKLAFQATYSGTTVPYPDAFVLELNPAGSDFVYSTYLGGSDIETGFAITVDASHNTYVGGVTASTNFPTKNPIVATYQGPQFVGSGFVLRFDAVLELGGACTTNDTCASGICVDGVCCDSLCGDSCGACDVAGHVGTCTAVTGAPHGTRPACSGTGICGASTCDGSTTMCALPGASTPCGSTCSDGLSTNSTCNGMGQCVVGAAHSCQNLVCADASTCKTACASAADCAMGFTCAADGTCQVGATCVDEHTSNGPNGSQDCGPYTCGGSGSCNTTCKSVDDCIAPNVCDPSSHCVAPPTSNASSSGCSASGRPVDSLPGPLGLAMVALVIARRRSRQPSRCA